MTLRPLPPSPNTPSPPPLPVKQVRRSIVPGFSGYDSDTENQPQVTGQATPGGRSLRSAVTSGKKSPAVLSQAVTKTRRSDVPSKLTPSTETPESTVRVLRSRNTPASVTQPRCDFRTRTTSASATPKNLPETGVKRKRSADAGAPTLASKMLKLSQHAKAASWVNPLTKRVATRCQS
jgi:hypothetical protein